MDSKKFLLSAAVDYVQTYVMKRLDKLLCPCNNATVFKKIFKIPWHINIQHSDFQLLTYGQLMKGYD